MVAQQPCPCGRGPAFMDCCGRYITQSESAPTAEALMCSRYTAYVRGDESYLLQTWHASTRPIQLELDDVSTGGMQWLGLDIVSVKAGDTEGRVEFIAHYRLNGRPETLHETSRFLKENGQWYYFDGEIHVTENKSVKIARNAPCHCGSGKKYKRCCGR